MPDAKRPANVYATGSARLLAQYCAYAAVAMLLCTDRGAAQYVPYFPTPQPLVDRMLEMADVKASDFLIDWDVAMDVFP